MELKKIARFIINDPIRKLFAIIFAFGLWVFVAIGSDYQYEKDINIVYTDLPDSLILIDSVPTIKAKFIGRGGALFSIWATNPRAQCSLLKKKPGKNTIPTKELFLPIDQQVVKVSYYKKSITVSIDKKTEKNINISIPLKGTLKPGYAVNRIYIYDTIKVVGPRSILNNLNELSTESLSVKNRALSFSAKLAIIKPPLINLSKNYVNVKIEIDTAVEKIFTRIPLKLIYSRSQNVSSEKLNLDTLIVSGPRSRVEHLSKHSIQVRIELRNYRPGNYNLPAEIVLPPYIKPIYSKPKRFKIKIY